MTEEERRNRNPKPEIHRITLAELNECRIMALSELQYGRAYIMQSPGSLSTMNFMGRRGTVYHFAAPRLSAHFFLEAGEDGRSLQDGYGKTVLVREFKGRDQ